MDFVKIDTAPVVSGRMWIAPSRWCGACGQCPHCGTLLNWFFFLMLIVLLRNSEQSRIYYHQNIMIVYPLQKCSPINCYLSNKMNHMYLVYNELNVLHYKIECSSHCNLDGIRFDSVRSLSSQDFITFTNGLRNIIAVLENRIWVFIIKE